MYCSSPFATSVLWGGGWSVTCSSRVTPQKLSVPMVQETGLCIYLSMYKMILLCRKKLAELRQMYHLLRMPQTTTNVSLTQDATNNHKCITCSGCHKQPQMYHLLRMPQTTTNVSLAQDATNNHECITCSGCHKQPQMYHLLRIPQATTNLTHNMRSYDNPNTGSPTAPIA